MRAYRLPPCIKDPPQAIDKTLGLASPTGQEKFAGPARFVWRIEFRALKVKPHGAVHLHHRRRGFLARKRSGIGGFGRAVAGAWLQGSAAQARSLSQSRSRNDVALPAWRSVRDRRRRGDRSRSRSLRTLHRAPRDE